MKHKILLISVAVMLVIGLVISGCAKPAPAPAPAPTPAPAPSPAPAPEPKTLEAVGFIPVDNIAMAFMWKYKDLVEQYSDGQLIIDILGASEVIPTEEQIFALKSGNIDMLFSMGDDIAWATPLGFAMVLTNMKPWEEREKGIWDYYREILARDCNAYWLGHMSAPLWFLIGTNVAAKSPDDLKELRIRCGATHYGSVEAIGAKPVGTPMMDIYTAMERGVIDAFAFPPLGWTQWGWHEVTKYWVGPRLMFGQNTCPLVNLDVWNSLSEEEQNWMTQPVLDHEMDFYAWTWWTKSGQEYGEESLLRAGLQRIEWTDEDNKWFQRTWRAALWDYVEGKMDPADFARFEKLVGH